MPLKLYKRGKTWWISGSHLKQTLRRTTGTNDREAAEAILARTIAEITSDHVYGKKARVTFDYALKSYVQSGGNIRFLGGAAASGPTGLLGHFFDKTLKDITQNDLDAAARKLYPAATPETRNRQCYTPFIAVWNHAVKNGWADVRIWSRPKKAKGTNVVRIGSGRSGQQPVDYEHAAQFVSAMSPAPAMLMTFLFYTGLRPIEAFALQAADVDVDKRWLLVRTSKTGQPRGVPLHSFLAQWLPDLVARGGILFRGPKGEPYTPVQSGGGGLKSAINGARRRSGILDVSPYTGRHSVSTQLVINGVHQHIKDQILGHAVDDMSRHYTNVPQAPLIAAVETLPVGSFASMPWVAAPREWWGKLADGKKEKEGR